MKTPLFEYDLTEEVRAAERQKAWEAWVNRAVGWAGFLIVGMAGMVVMGMLARGAFELVRAGWNVFWKS